MTTDITKEGQFRIDNNARHDCSLYCYINIDGHILVRVVSTDWDEDGWGEPEVTHDDAGIELTTEMAISLRDQLNILIEKKQNIF